MFILVKQLMTDRYQLSDIPRNVVSFYVQSNRGGIWVNIQIRDFSCPGGFVETPQTTVRSPQTTHNGLGVCVGGAGVGGGGGGEGESGSSAPSQVGPGQLGQVNCIGAQVWGKGG